MMMQLFVLFDQQVLNDQFPSILAFIARLEHVWRNKLAQTFNWVTKSAKICTGGLKGEQEWKQGKGGGAPQKELTN